MEPVAAAETDAVAHADGISVPGRLGERDRVAVDGADRVHIGVG
jgi:hypothetical protein